MARILQLYFCMVEETKNGKAPGMYMKENTDIESAPDSICPVTG